MRYLYVIFLVKLLSFSLFAASDFSGNLAFQKAKKLVQKEEQIAKAYKEYLLKKGSLPVNLNALKDESLLASSFSIINDFNNEIKLNETTNNFIENNIGDIETQSISKFYDYYYSNSNRVYTIAPKSLGDYNVEIKLSSIEEFIFDNSTMIITSFPDTFTTPVYYLNNRTLTYYKDNFVDKTFTYDSKDIIVYADNISGDIVSMLNNILNIDGTSTLMIDKYLSLGTKLYVLSAGSISQYIYLKKGETPILLSGETSGTNVAKLLITPYSGGYLLNGDIYTWGNNANSINTVSTASFHTGSDTQSDDPTILTPLRLKVKSYDSSINTNNFFSSPLRTKFTDFFASVDNGTCGITKDGELYCTGYKAANKDYTVTNLDRDGDDRELLYKVPWFDGSESLDEENEIFGKANQVLAIDKRWYVLNHENNIYTWGSDSDGFEGDGSESNSNSIPKKIDVKIDGVTVPFKKLARAYEDKYKKMFALSDSGEIYLWGMDSKNSDNDCEDKMGGVTMNLCEPTNINLLINNEISFKDIKSSGRGIIAISSEDEKYYIYQSEDSRPTIQKMKASVTSHSDADSNTLILDVDLDAFDDYSSDKVKVVWIEKETNELKGDFNVLNLDNNDETKLIVAIKSLKWKKIKFIEEEAICGITTTNQLYCWGDMGFKEGLYETTAVPLLNSNSISSFILDGGDANNKELKYPTYISGFNYDFIFK